MRYIFILKQVDDDFIAAYQASYGVTQEPAGTNVATAVGASAAATTFTVLQVGWVYVCSLLPKGLSVMMLGL